MCRRFLAGAMPGDVAPRPGEANTRGESSASPGRPRPARSLAALWRARARLLCVRPGAHKTRRSSCRARCCRRGHKLPARCSGCGARKRPQRQCRYGGAAACTHAARRAPLGAEQRSARAARARGTLRVERRAGRQCARHAHLFSDSISRYFMRPALASSASGGARGGRPGEVRSHVRRGVRSVQVHAAARVHILAHEAPRRQNAEGGGAEVSDASNGVRRTAVVGRGGAPPRPHKDSAHERSPTACGAKKSARAYQARQPHTSVTAGELNSLSVQHNGLLS